MLPAAAAIGIWLGAAQSVCRAQDADPNASPTAAGNNLDPRQRLEAVEKMIQGLETCQAAIPHQGFDPAAVAEKVGKDPQRLLAWVRENTRWVPYRGELRGPQGVLMDGTGNSLDRALLLAKLLRLSGLQVRLARAELDENAGAALLAKVWPGDKPANAAGASGSPDAASPRDPEADKAFRELLVEHSQQEAEAAVRIAGQTAWLQAKVGELAGEEPVGLPLAAIRDHWWVQCHREGKWTDLDLLAEAPAVTSAETVELGDDGHLPVGSPHWQQVQCRVIVEQWDKGKLKESEVLSTTIWPARMIGQPIYLFHNPLKLAKTDADLSKTDSANTKKWLLAQTEWVPVLTVGAKSFCRSGFDAYGAVVENPNPQAEARFAKAAASVMGGLGGMLGGGDDSGPPVPATVLTAEWIEYEFEAPGQKPWKIRRPVMDLLGPAARSKPSPPFRLAEAGKLKRAGVLSGRIDILCLPGQPSSRAVLAGSLQQWLTAMRRLRTTLPNAPDGAEHVRRAFIETAAAVQGPLYRWAQLRFDWSKQKDVVFLAAPNVVNLHWALAPDAAGEIALRMTLDIVANDVACRGDSPLEARFVQGVADAVAEADSLAPWSEADNLCRMVAVSEAQKVKWGLVQGAKDLPAGLAADAREWIAQSISRGELLVVPAKPLDLGGHKRLGWWSVDPRSGRVLAVLDDGLHANNSEYTAVTCRASGYMWNSSRTVGVSRSFVGGFRSFYESFGLTSRQVFQQLTREEFDALWWLWKHGMRPAI